MPTPKTEKTAGSDTLLPRSSRWYFPLALTALLAAVYFLAQERIGINYADEGYLWYGVQRVLAGEAPIRDFLGYDPGRYYWAVAWCFFLGDSLFDVRIANLAFAAGGVLMRFRLRQSRFVNWTSSSNTNSSTCLMMSKYPFHGI